MMWPSVAIARHEVFGGLIEELGVVSDNRIAADGRLLIACAAVREGAAVGDSIAVNGCCLTVVQLLDIGFVADVMPETGRRTNLGDLEAGDEVNLEASLRLGDRLGGHLLSGHVDGVGRVRECRDEANARWVEVAAAETVEPYLVAQGSIAVDGISLTVVSVHDGGFAVSLIPHTLQVTVAHGWVVGSRVNLEADMLARHVHRSMAIYSRLAPSRGDPSNAARL